MSCYANRVSILPYIIMRLFCSSNENCNTCIGSFDHQGRFVTCYGVFHVMISKIIELNISYFILSITAEVNKQNIKSNVIVILFLIIIQKYYFRHYQNILNIYSSTRQIVIGQRL